MNQDIQTEYLERYLALKPIYDKFEYISGEGEEYITSAFCVLCYIKGFDDIQDDIKQEINKNCFETSSEPTKYVIYAKYYIREIDKSIEDIPYINKEQIKKWLKKYFNIKYVDFNSVFHLLTNEESLSYLGNDWLSPGDSPSIHSEFQKGLYHFTKLETAKMIKQYINTHLKNTIDSDQYIKNSALKENQKFIDYFDKTIFDVNKMDLIKKLIFSNNRQKDIASITCVLTEKSIIYIKKRGRAKFFRVLYNFIDIEPPEKFSGINFYINSNEYPIKIRNADDDDYVHIKSLLEKIL